MDDHGQRFKELRTMKKVPCIYTYNPQQFGENTEAETQIHKEMAAPMLSLRLRGSLHQSGCEGKP